MRSTDDDSILTNICENVKTMLLSLPPEKWGTIVPGNDIEGKIDIQLGLDPDEIVKATKRTLFIMPVILNYMIQDSASSRGRTKTSVLTTALISTAIVIPFKSFMRGDVCNWDEVRSIIKFRERLETNIMANDLKDANFGYEYSFKDCEPEAPVEIELNQRNYVAVTDYTFELNKCVR